MTHGNGVHCDRSKGYYVKRKSSLLSLIKKAANPLRLRIVLSHHMHRNGIGKSEAGRN